MCCILCLLSKASWNLPHILRSVCHLLMISLPSSLEVSRCSKYGGDSINFSTSRLRYPLRLGYPFLDHIFRKQRDNRGARGHAATSARPDEKNSRLHNGVPRMMRYWTGTNAARSLSIDHIIEERARCGAKALTNPGPFCVVNDGRKSGRVTVDCRLCVVRPIISEPRISERWASPGRGTGDLRPSHFKAVEIVVTVARCSRALDVIWADGYRSRARENWGHVRSRIM